MIFNFPKLFLNRSFEKQIILYATLIYHFKLYYSIRETTLINILLLINILFVEIYKNYDT